jgi:DNA-binding response OmpR family regulator
VPDVHLSSLLARFLLANRYHYQNDTGAGFAKKPAEDVQKVTAGMTTINDQLDQRDTQKRILIVEDELIVADMLMAVLEMAGYHVTWVDRATAAFDLLTGTSMIGHTKAAAGVSTNDERTWEPDLILLDLSLPEMSGAEMIRQVAQVRSSLPPIIIVSAQPLHDIEQATRTIPATHVVRKPFDTTLLLERVAEVVNNGAYSNPG